MKYRILSAETYQELQVLVNDFLKAGWEVQGGVSSVSYQNQSGGWDFQFYQAITLKYE